MLGLVFLFWFVLDGILRWSTGRSSLVWGAQGLLLTEAALLQAARELDEAARRWWRALPVTLREVREEALR